MDTLRIEQAQLGTKPTVDLALYQIITRQALAEGTTSGMQETLARFPPLQLSHRDRVNTLGQLMAQDISVVDLNGSYTAITQTLAGGTRFELFWTTSLGEHQGHFWSRKIGTDTYTDIERILTQRLLSVSSIMTTGLMIPFALLAACLTDDWWSYLLMLKWSNLALSGHRSRLRSDTSEEPTVTLRTDVGGEQSYECVHLACLGFSSPGLS